MLVLQPLDYLCRTCTKAVCSECVIENHRLHDILRVAAAAVDAKVCVCVCGEGGGVGCVLCICVTVTCT